MAFSTVKHWPDIKVEFLGGSSLAAYALDKYKASHFKSLFKKAFTYIAASLLVAPLYITALCILHFLSIGWTTPAGFIIAFCMIFAFPWLTMVAQKPVRRKLDELLYKERLDYRQMVLSLPKSMGNVLSISELGESLVQPLPRALEIPNVSLLLPSNGHFTSQFDNHLFGVEPASPIKLSQDSPLVKWLEENNEPLFTNAIASKFKKLSDVERNAIRAGGYGLLMPMVNKGRLIGILALGHKRRRAPYSRDDIDLLTKVSGELAGTMANAQLYTMAKDQVHIDDLTGLLSHGYFHKRIDEEIARCSRFGNIFSVLFLDVDLFKSYNDAFGHLAGDDILKEISRLIRASIRSIDIPCRYGGDEFAVVLPESPLDDAYNVAERIRKKIESEMDSKGIAITCSIGVASWPTSGAAKESLLMSVDSALYLSKQAGRNRVSLASAVMSVLESNTYREDEVLSAVHALAATVDAKDRYTYGHSKKASEYAVQIANALGYTSDKIAMLKAAALLHDIGKIRVPDNVLLKPGPLNNDEWIAIREHPKFGVIILKHIKGLSGCLPIIQHHHEHFDGKGYPAGLTSDKIPFDARILAVADAYDAMTSPRPYRPQKMHHQDAIDELMRCAGTHFDPEIVKVFTTLWEPLNRGVLTGSSR